MSLSALDYRKRRNLAGRDEQMALLVQRVSGSHYDHYYMPCAAGVGYSYSMYRFDKKMDPSAGMLRLVMGLGTSAVDRTEGSYPRLVNLDRPEATNFVTVAEKHQFSQRKLEVIDKEKKCLQKLQLQDIEPKLPRYLKNALLEHDYEIEQRFSERGQYRSVMFISCKGLVSRREMMKGLQEMMQTIQKEYGQPVDIEFTLNLSENREYMINLLQCRPLQAFEDTGDVRLPETIQKENLLLHSEGASMGLSRALPLDLVVYVDPISYYKLPYAQKDTVAKAIGRINWRYRGSGKHMMLFVPGRVGTTSPELGVPTTFADSVSCRCPGWVTTPSFRTAAISSRTSLRPGFCTQLYSRMNTPKSIIRKSSLRFRTCSVRCCPTPTILSRSFGSVMSAMGAARFIMT